MSWLSLLLIVKIIVTSLVVAAPFMLLPKSILEKITHITAATPLLFRLYGIALIALLVGYTFGIISAETGRFPWGVASMGVVSNGGAAIVILAYLRSIKLYRLSAAFFGLICLCLIAAMIMPAAALQKVW